MRQLKYPNIEAERARHGLTIGDLAEKLNVSELWLIGDGAPADIDNRQGLDALSADERTFLTIYRRADLEGKKFLLDTAKIFEIMKKNK